MTLTLSAMVFAKAVWARLIEIVSAPFSFTQMFWILIPMILAMILMSLYFGRYKKEELGWNTAFGNSLILIFASVDMLRYQYIQGILFTFSAQNVLIIAIIIEAVLLTFLTFFHLLPKSWAFSVASGITVNVILLFAIILIYAKIPLDMTTAVAAMVLAIVVVGAVRIAQIMEPEAVDEDES